MTAPNPSPARSAPTARRVRGAQPGMPKPRQSLTGPARAKARAAAAALYASGLGIREVAKSIGVSFGGARTLLIEEQVQLRPPRLRAIGRPDSRIPASGEAAGSDVPETHRTSIIRSTTIENTLSDPAVSR